jgi:hypothetical protein
MAFLLVTDGSDGGDLYIGVCTSGFPSLGWTPNKNEALGLARRQDADKLAELIDDCWRIEEHEL